MTESLGLRARYRREPASGARQGTAEEDIAVPVRTAALLLVDVYPREGPHADVVRDAIAPAREAARRAGVCVVYVTNHLGASTTAASQWRRLWQRTLGDDVLTAWKEPSDALAYLPEIEPGAHDVVVRKQHYSGFLETELDQILRERTVRDLFIAGFDARICVAATATDALARDYRVIVLRDAIATTEMSADAPGSQSALTHALRYIEVCVGYTITTRAFVDACAEAGTHAATDLPALPPTPDDESGRRWNVSVSRSTSPPGWRTSTTGVTRRCGRTSSTPSAPRASRTTRSSAVARR